MISNRQDVYIPSNIKLNISLTIDSLTMDEYDFKVEAYARDCVAIEKAEAKRVDANNYIIKLNTAEIGPGKLTLKVYAFIPDPDFDGGIRTEVTQVKTNINVIQ